MRNSNSKTLNFLAVICDQNFYVLLGLMSEQCLGWKESFNLSNHTYVFLFC